MLEQIVLNTITRGGEIAALAIGVTILFNLLRFANFAHGEIAVFGAYFSYVLSVSLGLPLWLAMALGALLAGVLALGCDTLVFRHLRTSPGVVLLVASLGVSILLRAIASAIWGVEGRMFSEELGRVYRVGSAVITGTQLTIVVVTFLAMGAFYVLLKYTQLGRAMRAMSDNMSLARARGIRTEPTIRWIWFIGGAYAGLGGTFIAMDTLLWPDLGFEIILVVFAAAVLGGIGSIAGSVLGAFLLAFLESFFMALDFSFLFAPFGYSGSLFVPTGYKMAISFIVLVMVLLLFPRGIMSGGKGD